MSGFYQNDELSIPGMSPLVAANQFLTKTPDTAPLPRYEDVKPALPRPLWEGYADYLRAYDRAWQIAFSNLNQPAPGTGFVSNFIDTAFNGCLFMWDSVFILMFGKYANRVFPFQSTLDNFYSHQHRDGFICREIEEKSGKDRFTRHDPSATGPELLAWCEWEYYRNSGDKERLAAVFPPLMGYHRWMKERFTWPDGTYFSSGWGCGMDNIPRQSGEYHPAFGHGHMIWVDTCLQEIHNCNCLISMARELGEETFCRELTEERDLLLAVVNEKLWDEKTGFYYDLWRNGQHNMVRHVGAFWALLAGCAPEDRAERMMSYLTDEAEFKTPFRVPALSRSSPYYDPTGRYWCGGVWAPTTYMVLKGLDRYGRYGLSHEIGRDYLQAVVEVFKETGTFYENYAPEFAQGKPCPGNPARADFVGWTGLAPISVLLEYVFGIKPQAEQGKISWHIELTEKHGVERYPFGKDGELTLICQARKSKNETPEIIFDANVPVELEVIWGEEGHKRTMLLRR